ncbi:MAG TPA: polysaccharide deacetylase family protein [Pyrinomonadaceae bacterium]|jgi:peptidoglycan/xylan/chitin deacetylase (PgdA/CDA1 family)|nr:polysaccharide deacetylase family protein [Pyrinomonadaceae bacterium]
MPPVLLYHKIDHPTPDVKIRGAFTSPKRFAKQMSYLKKQGFIFHTAAELIKHYCEHGEFPARGISVTFDDGWKDNFTHAFPVMRELGIKATIFLVASLIGKVSDQVTAEGEGPREHLSTENIVEMSEYGIEFGSHSLTHLLLNEASVEEIEKEVRESKSLIENLVQKPCETFAYPAGFFTEEAKKTVSDAGYNAAFTTVYGDTNDADLFELNRVEILRRDGRPFGFARKIRAMVL